MPKMFELPCKLKVFSGARAVGGQWACDLSANCNIPQLQPWQCEP